ncbi:predicted protein [Uncinocarpus reesii 1704]|uniref:Aminoglycoside phosphotransferase domain-containing protein n=1 Tax=Uncinocarpus reesii (strain UAMH 1704) TaxID=336963 RepID=C4JNP6_UNCRE|nr:uncharacterized protein UREG_03044 [Uncinocarpus reesii 1704]EEP78199.1 predicted protein [Uncinocarpus reesii 1704]
MDQITEHKLNAACNDFVAGIDPLKVCDLATSCHPKKVACHILGEWKRGSYNICIPVVFEDDGKSEKWVVRIPLLPRLAFPEEKMRSEIATMKYITEKTTIPIPRIHGYSITGDNILGLPFLIIEYIEGNTLHSMKFNDFRRKKREHLYAQLGDIYIQLFRQQFDRIGALTLTEGGNWTFTNTYPLTIDINEQEISGLDARCFLNLNHTFQSTIDYIYSIVRLISNDFHRGRESILNENDAQLYLYSIYACQSILMEWVQPEFNHGPFVLMHGDLRPPNIIVDDNLNIISVRPRLGMEPHSSSSNISDKISFIGYLAAANSFCFELGCQEYTFHNPEKLPRQELPLTKHWWDLSSMQDYLIPLGLLAPHYFSNIYWKALDSWYYGPNGKERVQTFFGLDIRKPDHQAVRKKVEEYESYKKEREELGIEATSVRIATTAEELSQLAKALKKREIEKAEAISRNAHSPQQQLPFPQLAYQSPDISTTEGRRAVGTWLFIAFSTMSAVCIISGRLIK